MSGRILYLSASVTSWSFGVGVGAWGGDSGGGVSIGPIGGSGDGGGYVHVWLCVCDGDSGCNVCSVPSVSSCSCDDGGGDESGDVCVGLGVLGCVCVSLAFFCSVMLNFNRCCGLFRLLNGRLLWGGVGRYVCCGDGDSIICGDCWWSGVFLCGMGDRLMFGRGGADG